MPNWQEKIDRINASKEAELARTRGERDRLEKAKKTEERNDEIESFAILSRFRVSEQLNGINKDIWGGVGVVETKLGAHLYSSTLRFEYKVAVDIHTAEGGRGDAYTSTTPTRLTKPAVTALSVSVVKEKPEKGGGYFLEIDDYRTYYWQMNSTIVSVNHPKAQERLEEELLMRCIYRQEHKRLPLQIKAEADEKILQNNEILDRTERKVFFGFFKGK